jgi:hypothetical protein
MLTRILFGAVILTAAFTSARADFQYQSTSRVTGGALIQMMRFVPGGGALKEPQVSTVAVQGNRLVRRSKRQGEIIDLDRRTITTINFEKRTYTEMTFDQMKQALQQASDSLSQQRAQQESKRPESQKDAPNVNLNLDADVKNTGLTKTISGMEAHQVVMTMTMSGADPQSGTTGAMKMTSEMWLAKDVPGAREMREFYARMAKELDWAPTGMGGMMNNPDITRAMTKMVAEGEKMDGTPIQQVMRISGEASGVAGDPQTASTQTQSSQTAARPSLSDALGGALGGKLGGLGGFGKKKKDPPADAPADSQTPQQASGSLIEMTIESTGFSTSGVDASLFAVPADFKKVEESQPAGRRK